MAAGKHNLTIEQGSTFMQRLTYKDSAGALIDLTGFSARMQIRGKITDAATILSLTEASGITLGGASGTIDILISDTDTSAMNFKIAVYDLEIVDTLNQVTRLIEGKVTLSPEVTR